MTVLLALLLAAPGTIRVQVEGDATEVVALQEGAIRARAPVRDGRALLEGLPEGSYDVYASGDLARSDVELGVRTVHDGAAGIDARLGTRPAHAVTVRTAPGAAAWADGAPVDVLPEGFHRIFVDHPERVPTRGRIVRVGGPLELDVPLEPGLVVLGRVTDASGEPVAGAHVEAHVDGYATGRATFTSAAGDFGLGGFRGDVVSLRVRARGFADALHRVHFAAGTERARATVALRAGSGAGLSVRDTLGRPLPGAEAVLLPAWYERTLEEPRLRANYVPDRRGARSAVRFDGLTPGAEYRVLVRAPGHRPRSTKTFRAPAAGGFLALPSVALAPGGSVTGRVAAGPGYTVVCEGREGRRTSRTDRQGRFRFGGLDPGKHFLFVADVDERGTEIEVPEGVGTTVDLPLEEAPGDRGVKGVVTDHEGKLLKGVVVECAGRRASSGDDGSFLVERLPLGRSRFQVRLFPGPGCTAFLDDPHLPRVETAAPGESLHVRLDRAAALDIELDTGGRPLARAKLLVAGASGERRTVPLPRGARTAVVSDLPQGAYVVEVAAPGFVGTAGASARTGEHTRIVVERGRTATGRLVLRQGVLGPDGATLEHDVPLGSGHVSLFDPDPLRATAVTAVEPDGTFRLAGLPPAKVLLCAAAPGYPAALHAVDLTGEDAAGLVFPLFEGVEAAVRVIGAVARPLPDARAVVRCADGPDIRDVAAFGRFLGVVAADEDLAEIGPSFGLERDGQGRIAAPFVAPGTYYFRVSADGYADAKFGVRARTAWAVARIRQLPDVPRDLAAPVRLTPAEKD